jgi:hypothetical protein
MSAVPSREPAEPPTIGRRGAGHRRSHPPSRGLLIAATLVAVALSGAVAGATPALRSVTAAAGGTSATLTYRSSPNSATAAPYSSLRLSISRDGSRVYDAAVSSSFCGTACWPDIFPGNRYLAVAQADGSGTPDVILDLYSGGAHCCTILQVYRFEARSGGYAILQRDFGDPGARLERLDGGYEFVSADDRFAYAFAAFAFSGLPLQIWSLHPSGFVDVTRRFPTLIARDAARQYDAYLSNRGQGFGLGFIAAWAADEDLLGHDALVARTLAAQNRQGGLRGADGLPHGSAFIAALQRFLRRDGYAP